MLDIQSKEIRKSNMFSEEENISKKGGEHMFITRQQKECKRKECDNCCNSTIANKCERCKSYNWFIACNNKEKRASKYEIGICWKCGNRFWICSVEELEKYHTIMGKNYEEMLKDTKEFVTIEGLRFPPHWLIHVVCMSFDNMDHLLSK